MNAKAIATTEFDFCVVSASKCWRLVTERDRAREAVKNDCAVLRQGSGDHGCAVLTAEEAGGPEALLREWRRHPERLISGKRLQ